MYWDSVRWSRPFNFVDKSCEIEKAIAQILNFERQVVVTSQKLSQAHIPTGIRQKSDRWPDLILYTEPVKNPGFPFTSNLPALCSFINSLN